jgi:hypothetical protein
MWNAFFMAVYVLIFFLSYFLLRTMGKENHNISVFDFILLFLATFRLTRLLVYDSIFQFARDYFFAYKTSPAKNISDLLSCPWCSGMWSGLLILILYYSFAWAWYFILLLATAGLASSFQIVMWKIGRE